MIIEWFIKFIFDIIDFVLSWLPTADEWSVPDLGPLFGLLHSADIASSGFVSESFAVATILLSLNLILFMFGLLRQLWRFVPFIGGG